MQEKQDLKANYQYAGFGFRFLAYWVDFLILFPLGLFVQSILGNDPFAFLSYETLSELEKAQQAPTTITATLIGLILVLVYYLIFWTNYDGATPGKKLLAIKIIKDDGSKLSYPVAFIRYIGFIISGFSIFLFGLAYLWIIWDKKKQAWHDKIAGTMVVKTEQQPKTLLAVVLTLITMLLMSGYLGLAMYKGFKLGLKDAQQKGTFSKALIQNKLEENLKKDQDKILSFAPSSCGLSISIPKTSDTIQGKTRKWLFEEVPLAASNFYVLDKDVFTVKEVQGSFIGYKDASLRLTEDNSGNITVGFPGLNIYCVDNTKNLTLEEFQALTLANKNHQVEVKKKTLWGEVELIPITLQGKDTTGKEFRDYAYIGVTEDFGKLLYIRLWAVETNDPNKINLEEDLNIIVRNLKYREINSSSIKVENNVEINSNVQGITTTREKAKSR